MLGIELAILVCVGVVAIFNYQSYYKQARAEMESKCSKIYAEMQDYMLYESKSAKQIKESINKKLEIPGDKRVMYIGDYIEEKHDNIYDLPWGVAYKFYNKNGEIISNSDESFGYYLGYSDKGKNSEDSSNVYYDLSAIFTTEQQNLLGASADVYKVTGYYDNDYFVVAGIYWKEKDVLNLERDYEITNKDIIKKAGDNLVTRYDSDYEMPDGQKTNQRIGGI